MEWLAENWIWVLIVILFVGMHLFGHGCHGGGKHHRNDTSDKRNTDESNET